MDKRAPGVDIKKCVTFMHDACLLFSYRPRLCWHVINKKKGDQLHGSAKAVVWKTLLMTSTQPLNPSVNYTFHVL